MGDGCFVVEPTPKGVNPYVGPGLAGVPKILARVMPTSERLSEEAQCVLFYRGRDREWLAKESGVAAEAVDEILDEGTGRMSDVFSVLEALGVYPMELPGPPALRL